jgi:hypothetical protein
MKKKRKNLPFLVRTNLRTGKFHISQLYKQKHIGQLNENGNIEIDRSEIESIVPWCELDWDQLTYIVISARINEFYCRACARLCLDPDKYFEKFCREKKLVLPPCELRDELMEQMNGPTANSETDR